ncbi:MAG: glycosyltransferase family 4 protein [Burkholderiales bacterium]|nr:glycosyltransferase family 4 protein [Burkholderiales bacterium]
MTTRTRLLFLVTEDWYFVSHRLALAIAAKEAGFEVFVATRASEYTAAIRAQGIEVIPFAMARRGLNPLGLLREAFGLAQLYRRLRPDLVHHVALRPVVVGGLAARMAGVPHVVAALTGMGFLFTDGARRHWARRVLEKTLPWLLGRGMTVVQNPTDRALLQKLGIASARIRLIPGSGVDVTTFRPLERAPNPVPIVMLPARMLWDKGVGEFVVAARQLAGRARFVLVGGVDHGNPTAVPEAMLHAWVAEGVVEWWGHQPAMAEVLNQADVVCLPSYYREGMPKVLLEAMACAKPCVTTDSPGCRDCVRHHDNGLLVPARDEAALAAAIAWLLDHPAERQRMGACGRARALAEFAEERIVDETLALYRDVLS